MKTREQINAYHKEWYRVRRSRELCVWCGRKDCFTSNGSALCQVCADKNAERARRRRERIANEARL